ncbi:MAG: EAL domain-containing protein [Thiohalocapsa sp.]|nr:EAL domain-containing protein [Thiohalocapsa sp.]
MSGQTERTLAILYEMALTIGSADELDPLVARILQRLLYHSGFPAGLALLREKPGAALKLKRVIGSRHLQPLQGREFPQADELAAGEPRLLEDLDALQWLLPGASDFTHALLLPLPRYGLLLLLDRAPPRSTLPLTGMFRPILANLDRALENCLLRAASTRALVDEKEAAACALDREKERAMVTLRSIADGVITTDSDGRVDFINPVAEAITGWTAADAKGRKLEDIYAVQGRGRPTPAADADPRHASQNGRTVLLTRDGARRAVQESMAPIRGRGDKQNGAVLVFQDVTPQREMERRLRWQANHDALTGLFNRANFEDHLQAAIDAAHRLQHMHVLLYLDLDQFKVINDTCGHAAGDELLRRLGRQLGQLTRSKGILARLGGDEFGLLLERRELDEGVALAERIAELITRFRMPWEDQVFAIGVSIGVVGIDATCSNQSEILSAADMACYAAKELGGKRVHVYRPDDAEMAHRRGQMGQIARIQAAMEEGRFVLYRQAIAPACCPAQPVDHYEVLLRMVDKAGAIIAPGAVIPAAERYGLMPQLDRWVIRSVFRGLAQYKVPAGAREERYSINLSGTSLGDERLADFLREQFAEFQIAPRRIGFEITETAAIAHLERTRAFIRSMRELGCTFSLDDFGSGLSSFGYLRDLDVDMIKIDGAFVRDIAKDPIAREMVASIHKMAKLMGKHTIAEFVEDDAILGNLRQIGVDYAQGYLIDRPHLPPWQRIPATPLSHQRAVDAGTTSSARPG